MPLLLLAHSLHALACIVVPESMFRKRQIFFTRLSEYCTFGMMSVRQFPHILKSPSYIRITYMYTIQINVGLIKCNYNIYIYIVYTLNTSHCDHRFRFHVLLWVTITSTVWVEAKLSGGSHIWCQGPRSASSTERFGCTRTGDQDWTDGSRWPGVLLDQKIGGTF